MITSMIFFPDKTYYEKPESYGLQAEDVFLKTVDGVKIHGWWFEAEKPQGALLFFHGNAGNISGRLEKAAGWVRRGFSVFLLDYRGYGRSEGSLQSGQDILRDAEAAYLWLTEKKQQPPERLFVYGESLGTYPAIRLAAERRVAAVLLEAPFTSFADLAGLHYAAIPSFLADQMLGDFRFPNIEYISAVKAPVYFIHGTQDETCAYAMGEKLFELAPEPKGFFSIPGGGHNDLPYAAGEDFWEKPVQFLQSLQTS